MTTNTRGPIRKLDDERRRANDYGTTEIEPVSAEERIAFQPPAADGEWHEIAIKLYESFALSAQRKFYEPSDWWLLYAGCESLSRDLNPQVVKVLKTADETGAETVHVIKETVPLSGASLAAYLKLFNVLLATEGDRRRHGVEIKRASDGAKKDATVTDIKSKREDALA